VEEFVDAYCDLHIYKIGTKYKALMRKSLSDGWKTNVGESEIQEVPVQDKYKVWIDEVSSLFGGLLLCSMEAVVDIAGKEYIIEVNDCAMGLMGDGQDEDRKNIADLVINDMETHCKPTVVPPPKPPPPASDAGSRPDSSLSNSESVEKGKAGTSESSSLKGDTEKPKETPKKVEPKVDPAIEKKEEKPKKESKRDRSEEKARKEAKRLEKEAKREKERKKAEEEARLRREEEERREAERREEERKKKMQREESEESEASVITRQNTNDTDDTESESDSASESSNASSTIVRKGPAGKPKIKDTEQVPDTMTDLQATFSGIFGENKK